MNVYEDTLQGLHEALDYLKGDKTKGRSSIVEISDEEIEMSQILWQKIDKLPLASRRKAIEYVDTLLENIAV